MAEKEGEGRASLKVEAKATPSVIRGEKSWTFLYVALGFALSIEGTIIQMIDRLQFPWNLILYGVVGGITVWLLIFNGYSQNKLLAWKQNYESKAR